MLEGKKWQVSKYDRAMNSHDAAFSVLQNQYIKNYMHFSSSVYSIKTGKK